MTTGTDTAAGTPSTVSDTVRANRRVVLVTVPVAAGWLLAVLVVAPHDSWWALLLMAVLFGLLALAAGRFVLVLRQWMRPNHRDSPVRFQLDSVSGRLVVPPSRQVGHQTAAQAAALFALGSMPVTSQWHGHRLVFAILTLAALGMNVLVTVPAVGAVLAGCPRIELTPQAVTIRDRLGIRVIPWEALDARAPVRVVTWELLNFAVDRPELTVRRGLGRAGRGRVVPVDVGSYLVHPWFLADTVRYYRDHPEQRTAIGTAAGYQELLRTFGVEPH